MIRCFKPRDLMRLACYKKVLDFCSEPRTQAEVDGIFIGKNFTTIRRFVLDLIELEYVKQVGRKVGAGKTRSARAFIAVKSTFNELDLEPVALGKPVELVKKEPVILPLGARIVSFKNKHLDSELRKQDKLIRAEHQTIRRNNYAKGDSLSNVFL